MWIQHVGPGGPYMYHPWWWILGGLIPLLLMLTLIGLVVWAVVRFTSERSRGGMAVSQGTRVAPDGTDGALEQVRMRYARGEVGREEYLQIMRDLGAPEPPGAVAAPAGGPEAPPQDP